MTGGRSWKLRDKRGAPIGSTAIESVSARLDPRTGFLSIKVKVKGADLTDPGAGVYATLLNQAYGLHVDMDRRLWRSEAVKGGTRLSAP